MDVYGIVTERILRALDTGIVPWRCPWKKSAGTPRNLITGKPYSGINPFMLTVEAIANGYASPYWLTYKQAQNSGGNVKRGEKSSIVVFWKIYPTKELDKDGHPIELPVLRYYNVFNFDQCEGLADILPPADTPATYSHNPIASAEKIFAEMPNRPAIESKISNSAFYRPSSDTVHIPELAQFENPAAFYSTLFHELGHSTGHHSRLNRNGITDGALFGSHEYSKEELVAEFTSSFLCAMAEIERGTFENSAAYIRGWSQKLRDQNNRKWIVWAASQAQKAADYILGKNKCEEAASSSAELAESEAA
jgi:antirestriction protein ArdC